MDPGPLRDKRLLFVTGKGGTGRSTVAAALGLIAARRGRRTIVAELGGQDQVPRLLGLERPIRPDEEVELAPGLHSVSIDPERALRQYLEDQLPVRALSDLLSQSRMFQYLTAATPGLRELLSIGKIWDLVQQRRRAGTGAGYDLAIVDAPATGHAIGFLRAPRTFAEIARVGPVARHANTIDRMLRDAASTGVIVVAQPAEMPVNEAIALRDALRSGGPPLDAAVANGLYPQRFGPRDAKRLAAALAEDGRGPVAREALRAALSERSRVGFQREQLDRLAGALACAPVEVPFLFDPEWSRATVERLAKPLEKAL